jgi:hypothetical protein
MKTLGQYATVNGLELYYEVHGRGAPLVLRHDETSVAAALARDTRAAAEINEP